MLCFLCGKKIGILRALFDQQYCSPEHRKEARLASSQAFRDEEDYEPWGVTRARQATKKRAAPSAGQTASIFAFLAVGGLLVAALMLPGPSGGGGGGTRNTGPGLDPTISRGPMERMGDSIAEIIRSSAPVTLHQDFSSSLKDWATVAADAKDWTTAAARPNISAPSLRLWNKSTLLQNYQMEFQGHIERRSLSWAFRATDASNYYATRVSIDRTGSGPNASLLRYVVMNGRESDRIQLPLPVSLDRNQDYRVRVTIQDDRFVTYLNGQVISTWTDKRLAHGGVGFFNDNEDPQKVAWVSVSERDSFLGRMLAHFSLFHVPSPID